MFFGLHGKIAVCIDMVTCLELALDLLVSCFRFIVAVLLQVGLADFTMLETADARRYGLRCTGNAASALPRNVTPLHLQARVLCEG